MASAGQSYVQTTLVAGHPEQVMQNLISASASVKGYTVTAAGPNTVIVTRRYIPTWAIVVAIVTALVFLIGLLFLLVRSTETITIALSPAQEAVRVSISGVATPEMIQRLNAVLAGTQQVQTATPPPPPPPPPA